MCGRSTDLGAYRTDLRNLIVGNAPPVLIRTAALTATAFRTARVTPLIGRGLLDADEKPGAPGVVVLGYDVWQRSFEGRDDVVGSTVKLGSTPVTVVGVMPKGFRYPVSYHAWTPLQLRASYGALEGDPISIIGRLKPGITLEQANAELRVLGERAAAALPATHAHLRPFVARLGQDSETPPDIVGLALMYLPSLLVLLLACTTVGTLFYARTAIREGEMAMRSALGASRARIIGQLFVEALVLASIAAAVGLIAADRTLRWGIESVAEGKGGVPFWMTPGLEITTILYAGGLAVAGAAMLSLLPALRVTRTRLQSHLMNLGAGGSTLRFGRVWTTAMIAQVALTAIAIPVGIEGASQAIRRVRIHAQFPSHEYFTARLELDRPAGEEHDVRLRGAARSDVCEARATDREGTRCGRGHVRRSPAGGNASDRSDRVRRDPVRRRSGVPDWLRDIVGRPGFLRGLRPPDHRRTRASMAATSVPLPER